MTKERFHPVFTRVYARSFAALGAEDRLSNTMHAAMADPLEAADLAESGRELPHRLADFIDAGGAEGATIALVTASQWVTRQTTSQHAMEEMASWEPRLAIWMALFVSKYLLDQVLRDGLKDKFGLSKSIAIGYRWFMTGGSNSAEVSSESYYLDRKVNPGAVPYTLNRYFISNEDHRNDDLLRAINDAFYCLNETLKSPLEVDTRTIQLVMAQTVYPLQMLVMDLQTGEHPARLARETLPSPTMAVRQWLGSMVDTTEGRRALLPLYAEAILRYPR